MFLFLTEPSSESGTQSIPYKVGPSSAKAIKFHEDYKYSLRLYCLGAGQKGVRLQHKMTRAKYFLQAKFKYRFSISWKENKNALTIN
jgi:hypothetical protein